MPQRLRSGLQRTSSLPDRKGSKLTPTSVHEAGHAVAAHLLGRDIALVTIRPSKDSAGHMEWADAEEAKQGLATGIGRDFWLDSTALVAFAGTKAARYEFGDCSPNSFDGDLEVLNRLLRAVDRTEEKAVIDRWDEQLSALFRNPTFMPAVRSVARRLEERKTLIGFDVSEIVEAVKARGSKELPSWFIAGAA
jgi:hypothetical protein